jgi:transglutaminase-like putative cysteine protease
VIYHVRHLTRYRYEQPVGLCYNLAHLLPRSTLRHVCLRSHVNVSPRPAYGRRHEDYFGNRCYHFSIEEPHDELNIEVISELRTAPAAPVIDPARGMTCARALSAMQRAASPETLAAREFAMDSPLVRRSAALRGYAAASFSPDRSLLEATRELSARIFAEFAYQPGFTTVATPLSEVLTHRRGVCQDFAQLAIGCLRSLGFAARYTSGYLETLPPPGGEKLVGADASHAWFDVYAPGEGWVAFDPTNDQLAAAQHITCAWGRDYSDVAPLTGVIFGGGASQALDVSVDVKRVGHS